jgi:uncharacterized protein YbaR (Trm112 family)
MPRYCVAEFGEPLQEHSQVRGSFALPRLVCPETHQPLTEADAVTIGRLNDAVTRGALSFTGGAQVEQRLDGGLIRQDGQVLYPVIQGIPHLTIDQAIALGQLEAV